MTTESIILTLLGIIGCLVCSFCGYVLKNISKSLERLEKWLHTVDSKLNDHLTICNLRNEA